MASVGNLSYSFDIKTMCDYIAINEAIGYLFKITTQSKGCRCHLIVILQRQSLFSLLHQCIAMVTPMLFAEGEILPAANGLIVCSPPSHAGHLRMNLKRH